MNSRDRAHAALYTEFRGKPIADGIPWPAITVLGEAITAAIDAACLEERAACAAVATKLAAAYADDTDTFVMVGVVLASKRIAEAIAIRTTNAKPYPSRIDTLGKPCPVCDNTHYPPCDSPTFEQLVDRAGPLPTTGLAGAGEAADTPMSRIFGKWPGDETDEQIGEALRDGSSTTAETGHAFVAYDYSSAWGPTCHVCSQPADHPIHTSRPGEGKR